MVKQRIFIVNERSKFTMKLQDSFNKSRFQFTFIEDIKTMWKTIDERKPNAILLSELGNSKEIIKTVAALADNAETRNIRLIVLTNKTDTLLVEKLLQLGIREVILRTIHFDEIVNRIKFCISNEGADFDIYERKGFQFTDHLDLEVLGKIISMSTQQIVVEVPVFADIGEELILRSPLLDSIGIKELPTKVLDSRRYGLIYNLSQALILRPDFHFKDHQKSIENWIAKHKKSSALRRVPIFLTMKDKQFRKVILEQAKNKDYFLRFAWSKNTIFKEPLFLSPYIMFIDDVFITEESLEDFTLMLNNLHSKTTIIVNCSTCQGEVKRLLRPIKSKHNIILSNNLSMELIQKYIDQEMEKLKMREQGDAEARKYPTIYFPENYKETNCTIKLDAKLLEWYDDYLHFFSHHHIGRFSHIKINNPHLNHRKVFPAFAKITTVYNKMITNRTSAALRKKHRKEYYYEGYIVCFPEKSDEIIKRMSLEKFLDDNKHIFKAANKLVKSASK